jgi:hypothetical protein
MHAGEVGLFIDSQIFEDEWATIKQGSDVEVEATQGVNMRQFRLFWALMGKIAKSGALGDTDTREVADYILMKCKWVRYVTSNWRGGTDTTPVVKSFRPTRMDGTVFNRIFERALYIVTSEILPDMPMGELRDDVEKMAGVSAPDPAPAKPARQRRTKATAMPDPVSIIPAAEDFPGDRPMPESPVPMAHQPVPSAPVSTPKNFVEWAPWCRAWMAAFEADPEKTDQDAMQRWNSERNIRNDCGVSSHERAPIFAEYSDMLDRMRARGNALRMGGGKF